MIDMHIHVVPPMLPGTGSLHPYLKDPLDVLAARLRDEMRSSGIHTVLAMGEWTQSVDDPLGIARTLRIAEYLPSLRAIGVCDPTRSCDPEHMKRVDAELARGRVVALKCYLGYLHYEPAHPGYRSYYVLAAKHQIPVIFHTGDTYSPQAKLKFAHPLGVDEVAVDHPDTKFVIAHCGNPWLLDAAEVIYKNLNVWADLSGLVVGDNDTFADEEYKDQLSDLAQQVRRAFRYAERPNRFLFGSDWPLIPLAPYRQFIASLMPSEYHSDLFEGNARRLFKI